MHPIHAVHSISALVEILVFIIIFEDDKDITYEPWVSYVDPDTDEIVIDTSTSLKLSSIILAYLGMAIVNNLFMVWLGPRMERLHGMIWLRWVGYSLTTPFLIITMLLISGIRNLDVLVATGAQITFVNLAGGLSEYAGYCACISQNVYDTRRWWNITLLVTGLSWIMFIVMVVKSVLAIAHVPGLDALIVITNVIELAIFVLFGVVHCAYLWRVRKFIGKTFSSAANAHIDYVHSVARPAEYAFCALSTLSKSMLALIIIVSSDL